MNGGTKILGRTPPPSVPNLLSHLLDHERVGETFDVLFPRIMGLMVGESDPAEGL